VRDALTTSWQKVELTSQAQLLLQPKRVNLPNAANAKRSNDIPSIGLSDREVIS
jgi:hypothetical protein